jgi:hypothetical protein
MRSYVPEMQMFPDSTQCCNRLYVKQESFSVFEVETEATISCRVVSRWGFCIHISKEGTSPMKIQKTEEPRGALWFYLPVLTLPPSMTASCVLYF